MRQAGEGGADGGQGSCDNTQDRIEDSLEDGQDGSQSGGYGVEDTGDHITKALEEGGHNFGIGVGSTFGFERLEVSC